MNVRAGLHMDRNRIRSRLSERREIRVGRRDHQMNVEHLVAVGSERFHHIGPEGDVRHEMPVHHVEMNPVRPRLGHRANLLAKGGEVSREDRRGDDGAGRAGRHSDYLVYSVGPARA